VGRSGKRRRPAPGGYRELCTTISRSSGYGGGRNHSAVWTYEDFVLANGGDMDEPEEAQDYVPADSSRVSLVGFPHWAAGGTRSLDPGDLTVPLKYGAGARVCPGWKTTCGVVLDARNLVGVGGTGLCATCSYDRTYSIIQWKDKNGGSFD
jgi:hypothetical protein